MRLEAYKDSGWDPCVTCPFHNGEWQTCQAVAEELRCPADMEEEDGTYLWQIPDQCPLRSGAIEVVLKS